MQFWYRWVSATFLRAYLETADGGGFLPEREEDLDILLRALLLEKALYEVNYEANNRPEWVWIPVRGLQQLLHGSRQ